MLGAGLVGVETAEFLSDYRNQVTVMDMLEKIAPAAPLRVRLDLQERLKQREIRTILGSRVVRILEDGIICSRDEKEEVLDGFDVIVLAFGARASKAFEEQAKDLGPQFCQIGDAGRAGDAKKAIFEATKLALTL